MHGEKKHCGRMGKHLSHYWHGPKRYTWLDKSGGGGRWVKPVYFCTGYVQIEGGQR